MAECLQVAPNKLVLRFEIGQPATAAISLQNPTDERIAFKVKTTAPNRYTVKPAAGFLEGGGSAQLAVGMVAPNERPPSLADCKDRFLVEALVVGPEVQAASSELFKAHAADVSGTKLKVVLLEPKGKGASTGGSTPATHPARLPDPPAAAGGSAAKKAAGGTLAAAGGLAAKKVAGGAPAAAGAAGGSAVKHASTLAAGAGGAASGSKQQKQQARLPPRPSPAPATQLLPGASRLSKRSPAPPQPEAAQVPADVLAAFAAVPAAAPAAPGSSAGSPAAAEALPRAAEVNASPPTTAAAAAPATLPAGPAVAVAAAVPAAAPAPGGAAKFSSSLRNRMAKIEQQQARQRAAAQQPQQAQQQQQAQQPQQAQQQPQAQQPQQHKASPLLQHETTPPASSGEAVPGPAGQAAGPRQEQQAAAADPQREQPAVGEQLVGRAVSKRFGSKSFSGAVKAYDPEEDWYLIKYEDSDTEEIDLVELQRIMVPLHPQPAQAQQETPQQGQNQAHQQQAQQGQQAQQQGQQAQRQAAGSPQQSALASHHTQLDGQPGAAEDTAATAAAAAPPSTVRQRATLRLSASPERAAVGSKAGGGELAGAAGQAAEQQAAGPAAAAAGLGSHVAKQASAGKRGRQAQLADSKNEEDEEDGSLGVATASGGPPAPSAATANQEQPQARQQAARRSMDENSLEGSSGGGSSSEEEEQSSSEEEDSEEEDAGPAARRPAAAAEPAAAKAAAAPAAGRGGGWDSDSDWDAGEAAVGADSDSDYMPDEADLLPEERREQHWMDRQRCERSLVFTPAAGLGGGSRGMRRGSMSSVKVKAEPVTGAKPPRQPAQRQQQQQGGGGGGAETISLLSSDSEEDADPAVQRGSGAGPRTAVTHPPPTLRLSFRAAGGAARQRLAVMRVRSCTPLQRVLEAVATRCLEGGCAADAAALALSLGTAQLDPEHTVRQAGLQDGDLIEVSLLLR